MNSIKKLAKAMVLSGVIMMGVHTAQAGIIVNYTSHESKREACQMEPNEKKESVDHGIIVNLTGIIVNLTGIIVNFSDGILAGQDATPVDCGIIVN